MPSSRHSPPRSLFTLVDDVAVGVVLVIVAGVDDPGGVDGGGRLVADSERGGVARSKTTEQPDGYPSRQPWSAAALHAVGTGALGRPEPLDEPNA